MKPFRAYIFLIGIIGIYAGLIFRLYDLQIAKGNFYSARAAFQYQIAGFLEPHRGIITVTDKTNALIPIAANAPETVVIAVPREIRDIDRTIENISPILAIDGEKLRDLLYSKKSYQLLLKNPSAEQIAAVNEAQIAGIRIDNQEKRTYPFGSFASHIIGFVGPSDDASVEGRYGLEKQFNEALGGKPGAIENKSVTEPVQGTDIATTIDRTIQAESEAILKNLVEKKHAVGGTIMVQNPRTGVIIAMASAPDFNPNSYSLSNISSFTNPAVQARYEPGSVFKIITAAIGLNTGAFTPDTTYYDTGSLSFSDGKIIKNWDLKGHGTVTMTNVIEQSINTGAAFMERQIGHKPFYAYMNNFRFNEPTGIELPGEIAGNLKNIKTRTADIDFAAASFGQGVAVTPLQLITAVSAIANGGILLKPSIIMGKDMPHPVRRVLTEKAAHEVTAMMVSAVQKAMVAQIPHYTIAGKTGTAQAVDFVRGGYTKDVINTYVGFAPATKPQFTILIKLDKPEGAPLAGLTVVPAFRELAEFIINYYGIPPDNLTP